MLVFLNDSVILVKKLRGVFRKSALWSMTNVYLC